MTLIPSTNFQVTHDANPNNDRSESILIVNPRDDSNMIGASKRFMSPSQYQFSLTAYATVDGGQAWTETNLTPPLGDFTSDPAVTFDDVGNAYLVGLIWNNGPTPGSTNFLGLAAYTSSDGGVTWSGPKVIYSQYADKQEIAGDMTPTSPHNGNVYAAWDGSNGLQFGRTRDHGATWTGTRQGGVDQPVGSVLITGGIFASIAVAPDGKVYIFYLVLGPGAPGISVITSSDGGDTFAAPAQVVTGLTTVPPKLPGGQFRLETIPTSCVSGNTLVVAWPDYRSGRSEIFYRRSDNAGASWHGAASGDKLTTAAASAMDQQDFMPQLAATTNGVIGCCFYEFGPKSGSTTPRIDVVVVVSTDSGATFASRIKVTDQPWDPTIDVPLDNSGNAFIGDYFGFGASTTGFFPFWTDTRTGVQELFTTGVFLIYPKVPHYSNWVQILFGIVNDGGGVEIVGGHIVHVPPRGPELGMLTSILVAELAKSIPGAHGKAVRASALHAIAAIATKAAKSSR